MHPVQCPAAHCRAVFEIPAERFGRNIYCLACGERMTAKPPGLEPTLASRARRAGANDHSPVDRLPFAVIVDNVRSLWNVGSIFRSADACGVDRIALTGITGVPPRSEIRKTALGADEVVRWAYFADPLDALSELESDGFEPVVLEQSEHSRPIDSFVWPERPCLVVGNEVAGVSSPVCDRVGRHVEIPMRGVKASFNVAVAFGVAAYAAASSLSQGVDVAE